MAWGLLPFGVLGTYWPCLSSGEDQQTACTCCSQCGQGCPARPVTIQPDPWAGQLLYATSSFQRWENEKETSLKSCGRQCLWTYIRTPVGAALGSSFGRWPQGCPPLSHLPVTRPESSIQETPFLQTPCPLDDTWRLLVQGRVSETGRCQGDSCGVSEHTGRTPAPSESSLQEPQKAGVPDLWHVFNCVIAYHIPILKSGFALK